MAEMRTLEIPAEIYERLEQSAQQVGLSLEAYLEAVTTSPLSLAEKLKAVGKSPLLAFVGLANDPTDPHLSTQIRAVMETIFEEQEDTPQYSLLDLAGIVEIEEETDASERVSEIMQKIFRDKIEQENHDDSG